MTFADQLRFGLPASARGAWSLHHIHQFALGAKTEQIPFSWKPAFVRRSLGLAAVEEIVLGRSPSPNQAVRAALDAAVSSWEETGVRRFYWEPWLGGVRPAIRSAVIAEATTWATSIVSLLHGSPPDQWSPEHRWSTDAVTLRARAEWRTGSIWSVVFSGVPTTRWTDELGYVALVSSLAGDAPSAIEGVWVDLGERRTVEVTEALLNKAAALVLEVVDTAPGGALSAAVSAPGSLAA